MTSPRLTSHELIELLDLAPLEGEGGFYRETVVTPNPDPAMANAPLNTAILFLVTAESWSGLHKLETDELFHFHMGDTCRMVVCSPQGELNERRLGTDLRSGCRVQTTVLGGMWQGTMLEGEGEFGYALLGTTMTPGFRKDQFTLATNRDLLAMPPAVVEILKPFLSPDAD